MYSTPGSIATGSGLVIFVLALVFLRETDTFVLMRSERRNSQAWNRGSIVPTAPSFYTPSAASVASKKHRGVVLDRRVTSRTEALDQPETGKPGTAPAGKGEMGRGTKETGMWVSSAQDNEMAFERRPGRCLRSPVNSSDVRKMIAMY